MKRKRLILISNNEGMLLFSSLHVAYCLSGNAIQKREIKALAFRIANSFKKDANVGWSLLEKAYKEMLDASKNAATV